MNNDGTIKECLLSTSETKNFQQNQGWVSISKQNLGQLCQIIVPYIFL